MNGMMDGVSMNDGTLRSRCAPAHLLCQDRVDGTDAGGTGRVARPDPGTLSPSAIRREPVAPREPVPPVAPDDFTVIIGAVMAGGTMRGLEREMEALGGPEAASGTLLMLLQWVEDVFVRCREIQRDAGRLRGQVMAVAAALAGER